MKNKKFLFKLVLGIFALVVVPLTIVYAEGEEGSIPTPPTCPEGQELKDGACVDKPVFSCPEGKIKVEGKDECVDPTPAPVSTPVVDLCPNIEGDQAEIPEGKELKDGSCIDKEKEESVSTDGSKLRTFTTSCLPEPKVNVCHKDGDSGNWTVVNVSTSGWEGHSIHEADYLYAGPSFVKTCKEQREAAEKWCKDHYVPSKSTLVATKIVCDNETDLPNWGTSGADITSTTASTFLASHPTCKEVPWTFEWMKSDSTPVAEDSAVHIDGWTAFTGGTTDAIPTSGKIWVREQFDTNYIPFTYATATDNSNDVSAELYCNNDVLNYDNLEYINNLESEKTYYCVGFNVLKEKPVIKQCDVVSDTTNIVESGTNAVETYDDNSAWVKSTVLGDLAKWIWKSLNVENPTQDETYTFVKKFNLNELPTSATIELAADNGFKLEINEVTIDDKLTVETNYGSVVSYPVTNLKVGENTIRMTVKNFGLEGSNYASNPAGALYKLHIVGAGDCADVPPTTTSTVTMCKKDVTGAPLSNWQLMLVGDSVGSTQVNPTGVSSVISSVPAGNYIIKASGEYTYRPGSKGAEYSDAAYSKRAVSDAVYQAALLDPTQSIYLPWVRENNFPTSVKGWLGIIYNNAFTDWGSVYNPAHIYALGTTTSATNDMTFKILDDVYSDNSGFLTVDVNKGYIGTTEDDGCVTFEDVPYGTYTADEIMKDGWTNVSGIETVVVDQPTELFTLVNNDGTEPRDPTGSIEITKYVCPAGISVVRSANGVGKTVPEGCVAQSGKAFGYVHGEQTDANGPYPELTTPLTAGGTTNALGILTISDLPATGRYLVVETDDAGNKLGATDILGLYCEGDGDTSDNNDNQELTFVPDSGTAHCVAYNKAPAPVTYTLTINISGSGSTTGSGTYDSGTEVTATATPADGYYFSGWSGDCDADGKVTVDGNKTCTATFLEKTHVCTVRGAVNYDSSIDGTEVSDDSVCVYTLTITKIGDGTATETGDHSSGEVVVLSAVAGEGYYFSGWTGDSDCTDGSVTMDSPKACTVTFTPKTHVCTVEGAENYDESVDGTEISDNDVCTYELTVTKTGTGNGTVLGAGIYNSGATATLTATPDSSSNFTSWGGDCSGTASSTSLMMSSAKSCLAAFTAKVIGCMNPLAKNYNASAELEGVCTYYACNDGIDNTDPEDVLVDAADPACHTDGNASNKESYDYTIDSEVDVKQCSDGIDNDGDGFIDFPSDLGCTSATDDDEVNRTIRRRTGSSGGQVLGASTSCGIYVDKYLRKGYANNVEAVRKVQKFLNDYTDAGLVEDGIFGAGTEQALKKFQLQHADKILDPWNIAEPTGIFYLTTQTEVNNIMCPDLGLPIPTTLIPFSQNRSVPTI